jgi:hypothetical protein
MSLKELPKATPQNIEEQIRNFVTVSEGRWSFRISCKLCRDLGIISTNANGIKSKEERINASIKFARQGWRVDGFELVCPKCYKRHLNKL